VAFPDPRRADDDGLLAIGGDLSVARLLLAYDSGVFPWYGPELPPLWWSPDPRGVIEVEDLHVSRSMRRVLRCGDFQITWNRSFRDVMHECGQERETGTWILPEMEQAYGELHRLGHAHSLEVWSRDRLVGGLYGVQRGALFAAESMFHRRRDASKVALIAAVRSVFAQGIELFDVQFTTSHLVSLGAHDVSREQYLARLAQVRRRQVDLTDLPLKALE
jgi:leucyl/phenylalanyl-tRNA--protein transferase